MACVTLKRPVEVLGSPHMMEHEPMVKRRRCGMSLFPTTPPGTSSGLDSLNNGRSSPGPAYRHSLCSSPISASRGSKRAKRKLDIDHYDLPPTPPTISPFMSAATPLETGKLVAQLGQELKRLQHRKGVLSEPSPSNQTSLSSSPINANRSVKDQPLFTLKQVTIVCQRMMREREEMIRSEYDKVLTSKLSEQYDTFVKFSHDQVEKRLAESAFSYVS